MSAGRGLDRIEQKIKELEKRVHAIPSVPIRIVDVNQWPEKDREMYRLADEDGDTALRSALIAKVEGEYPLAPVPNHQFITQLVVAPYVEPQPETDPEPEPMRPHPEPQPRQRSAKPVPPPRYVQVREPSTRVDEDHAEKMRRYGLGQVCEPHT